MKEELLKQIDEWLNRYEDTPRHDSQFSMDAKDEAYSILNLAQALLKDD